MLSLDTMNNMLGEKHHVVTYRIAQVCRGAFRQAPCAWNPCKRSLFALRRASKDRLSWTPTYQAFQALLGFRQVRPGGGVVRNDEASRIFDR